MEWWSIALIVLAVAGLVVVNVFTGAGSRIDCAAKEKMRNNKKIFKDSNDDK